MKYKIVDNLTENQISELIELYKKEFWSGQRTRDDVVKMLAATDVIIGLVDESEKLIGFTRVLTDFIYRATIYDVIVKSNHRNMGLGSQLINAIISHPKLASVEVIALFCLPEMMAFYERWGFKSVEKLHLMFRNDASELNTER